MAHPYAPMGGSYDDRVVGIVVDEFLRKGWIVGTFNFRGAHGSKGRTSWSGKPELDDYISVAAFFIHYLSYLRPDPPPMAVFTPEQSPVSAQVQKQEDVTSTRAEDAPIVVLGGYSYGSLILRHMPPIPTILRPFAAPLTGSAADEILLRARKLADQLNLEWINLARDLERRQRNHRNANKLAVTMGGEETSPEKRRSSRDIRRSMDGNGSGSARRSLDIGNRLRSLSHRRPAIQSPNPQTPPETTPRSAIAIPEVRYLLVSPLTPPISTLAAPALVPKFWSKGVNGASGDVVAKHETLVVFGEQDIFSSVKKVREWVKAVRGQAGNSRFEGVEVHGAGHFWHEEGVERGLRDALGSWGVRVREKAKE
ncbi:hypothetical protein CC80DRAFT_497715 [Byssothecium circinans]|uniref:AB hydrolase-1 domain-containing protein n=1 Tax=Byssothecium circinans TaxID=147558 RepID=A0A6A5TBM4_9PLEO|nr:hypothetical protein CC80DRAFT_497715 [Byssothecium circinans]